MGIIIRRHSRDRMGERASNEWMFTHLDEDRWVAPYLLEKALERSKTKEGRPDVRGDRLGAGRGSGYRSRWQGQERLADRQGDLQSKDQDLERAAHPPAGCGRRHADLLGRRPEAQAHAAQLDRIGWKPTIVSAWGIAPSSAKPPVRSADGVLVAGTFAWTGQLNPRAHKVWERMKTEVQPRTILGSSFCRAAPRTPMMPYT